MQKLKVDPLTWVKEKPIRVAILEALEDVSFLAPGRDFKTIILAMQAKEWNKSIPGEIDRDGVMGSLPTLHRLGLVQNKRKKTGKTLYVKGGRRVDETTTYWRLTSEGIATLWAARNAIAEVPYGGSDPEPGPWDGRPLPLPEGVHRATEIPAAPEEDQRGHADDAGRPGEDAADDGPEDDPGAYHLSYRHRP